MTDLISSRYEFNQICDIADRAVEFFAGHGIAYDKMMAVMDIESAHQDIPLDLAALRDASPVTFAHDVGGIRWHMDRATFPGKLKDCFVPRTALPG